MELQDWEGLLRGYRENRDSAVLLNHRIKRYALGTCRDTHTATIRQMERIAEMKEHQRRLVNRCNFVNSVLTEVDRDDLSYLVRCYVNGKTYREMGKVAMSERTFYRRKKAALERFARIAERNADSWEL